MLSFDAMLGKSSQRKRLYSALPSRGEQRTRCLSHPTTTDVDFACYPSKSYDVTAQRFPPSYKGLTTASSSRIMITKRNEPNNRVRDKHCIMDF